MNLYNQALESDGAVSIGTGRANLFAPLMTLILQELETARDENVRQNLVSRLTTTLDIGHRNKIPGTADAVRNFAFEALPMLLKRQQQQYRNTATSPVRVIHDELGAKLCLQYVVERMEQYPQRLQMQYDNAWNAFGYELSSRRAEVGKSELDDRVLKLTTAQLRHYLLTGESNGMQLFYHGYGEFWAEKKAEFAEVAEAVLNEKRSSGRRALKVAEYFRNGLAMFPRAIEILHIAHNNGLLNESEQYTLATWLRESNRYAEMIPILEPLMRHHSDTINYRTDLMAAYFHTQRPEQVHEPQPPNHARGFPDHVPAHLGNPHTAVHEQDRNLLHTHALAPALEGHLDLERVAIGLHLVQPDGLQRAAAKTLEATRGIAHRQAGDPARVGIGEVGQEQPRQGPVHHRNPIQVTRAEHQLRSFRRF